MEKCTRIKAPPPTQHCNVTFPTFCALQFTTSSRWQWFVGLSTINVFDKTQTDFLTTKLLSRTSHIDVSVIYFLLSEEVLLLSLYCPWGAFQSTVSRPERVRFAPVIHRSPIIFTEVVIILMAKNKVKMNKNWFRIKRREHSWLPKQELNHHLRWLYSILSSLINKSQLIMYIHLMTGLPLWHTCRPRKLWLSNIAQQRQIPTHVRPFTCCWLGAIKVPVLNIIMNPNE